MLLARKLLAETVAAGGGGWDLSTASYEATFNPSEVANPRGVSFGDEGHRMYLCDSSSNIAQFSLSTPWDINTASDDNTRFSQSGFFDVQLKHDGTSFYALYWFGDALWQYPLSVPWDIGSGDGSRKVFSTEQFYGFSFSNDGGRLFTAQLASQNIRQYNLSTPWDIESGTVSTADLSTVNVDSQPMDISFKDDGTKMYLLGFNSKAIYQYSFSTPWEVSSASYDGVSFSVSSETTRPYGIDISDDGKKIYVVDNSSMVIHQYTME